jgi:two-component system, OmpR family, sensor kinase
VSLRTRLLLAVLAASVTGLAIAGVLTFTLVTRAQLEQVDQELERAHPPIERAAASTFDRERAIRDAAPGFYVELRDPEGESSTVVALQRPGEDAVSVAVADLPEPEPESETDGDRRGRRGDDAAVYTSVDSTGDHGVRVRVSRQPDGSILIIGRSLQSIEDTRERLLVVLLTASAGAVLVAGLLGAWLVRVGLRPLTAVERAASEISDVDLDRRVPGDGTSTEVGRLATAINHMLDRLQGAMNQREQDVVSLQESESRMRQFVADASHELRTPITATAAYAELFERGAKDRPDDLERAMTGIRSETSRMADLVEDLLLLARLDEQRPITRTPVDLAAVAFESVDAATAVAPDRPVRLRVDDVTVVIGDPSRLRQVLDNLLANVRTHTPPATACSLTVRREGDEAVVIVADEGPGMNPGDAARAFDRFHRADTSRTRASGGSGLGLSIVAAIVAAHDGSVAMSSAPGTGTTVTIRIPIAAYAS